MSGFTRRPVENDPPRQHAMEKTTAAEIAPRTGRLQIAVIGLLNLIVHGDHVLKAGAVLNLGRVRIDERELEDFHVAHAGAGRE